MAAIAIMRNRRGFLPKAEYVASKDFLRGAGEGSFMVKKGESVEGPPITLRRLWNRNKIDFAPEAKPSAPQNRKAPQAKKRINGKLKLKLPRDLENG